MNQQYADYLKSESWQKKRSERLRVDNYTCQRCGRKHNLNVHHLTYENIGNEDVYNDLITLCKSCHEKIEDGKKHKEHFETESMRNCKLRKKQAEEFFEFAAGFDLSVKGEYDLCNNEVIKEIFVAFRKWSGYADVGIPIKMINDHFRDKRYEVMEALLAEHPTMSAWQMSETTGFKYQMVDRFLKKKKRVGESDTECCVTETDATVCAEIVRNTNPVQVVNTKQ